MRLYRIDLVVVDTARAWFNLASEESNAGDVIGPALDALSPARQIEGAALVVLHQAPWDGKRARGSTEFHAAVDLVFHISGEGSEPRTIKYVRHDAATSLSRVLTALEHATEPLNRRGRHGVDASEDSARRWLSRLERWQRQARGR